MVRKWYRPFLGFILFFSFVCPSPAEQINIAVASNALAAMKVISAEFEKQTDHTVIISSGSTGKLYAQIINGAPFDVFFAANEREPERLEQGDIIMPDSRFTYAVGKLVAWSPDATLLTSNDIHKVLISKSVTRIAIANPKTAPYGLAALQAMKKMGVWNTLQSKIIRGENVSQTYQFAMTHNAQIGFVAKSQVLEDRKGSYMELPEEHYDPIRQQAVIINRSRHKPVALQFVGFIKSEQVKEILAEQFGYGVDSGGERN